MISTPSKPFNFSFLHLLTRIWDVSQALCRESRLFVLHRLVVSMVLCFGHKTALNFPRSRWHLWKLRYQSQRNCWENIINIGMKETKERTSRIGCLEIHHYFDSSINILLLNMRQHTRSEVPYLVVFLSFFWFFGPGDMYALSHQETRRAAPLLPLISPQTLKGFVLFPRNANFPGFSRSSKWATEPNSQNRTPDCYLFAGLESVIFCMPADCSFGKKQCCS